MSAPPYLLLDSGRGRKLEALGDVVVERQAAAALWSPRDPERWRHPDARHHRSDQGGGRWEPLRPLPEHWPVRVGPFELLARLTPFGHVGFFAEQAAQWSWIEETVAAAGPGTPPRALNLFAYTGGATLAAAKAGAEVCHVDAARGIVDWAREHARRNALDGRPIRWIVDDVPTFVERERRRARSYDLLILDPPSYGRGSRKEVWRLEDDLPTLLAACRALLAPRPLGVLLSCHTPGVTPMVLENLVAEVLPHDEFEVASAEMTVPEDGGRLLPAGSATRWRRRRSR